ncbi:MAG: lipid-binding SYLF domain-containing protein, partial [Steroidobacteraceae bacterium]
MNRSCLLSTLLCMAAVVLPVSSAFAQGGSPTHQDVRLINATEVLNELRATPDQSVPGWLMQRAYGIAVIPDVLKGAFLFGGRYGNGVLTVRNAAGRFSGPIFITLAGGSVGWQIGATSTDVVLVFVTPRSVQNFARGKFTLGVDASVAAGPVGRQGEADAGVSAEIYSYSRSRGLFAGVALNGTVLAFDRGANRAFYDRDAITTDMITGGKVTSNAPSAQRFLAAVVASANGTAAAPTAPPAAAAGAPAAPLPAAAPSPA